MAATTQIFRSYVIEETCLNCCSGGTKTVQMIVETDFMIADSSSFMIFGTPFDENSSVIIILK
jgi:hypothetical protein